MVLNESETTEDTESNKQKRKEATLANEEQCLV